MWKGYCMKCKFLIEDQFHQFFCFLDMDWDCENCLVYALKKNEIQFLEKHFSEHLQNVHFL